MLTRRFRLTSLRAARRGGSARRFILEPAAYLVALLLLPAVLGIVNLTGKLGDRGVLTPPPIDTRLLPSPPVPDSTKKIAVVLASAYGAEITDFVAPYEILARSGAFDVFAVAPERKVLPLVNANMAATTLDFVPHFSFAEYETLVGRTPDVIAIPWFPDHTPERDAAVLAWIRAHAGPHTTLLTICAGTQILAETGLLDGRTATTNVGWFERVEAGFPSVTWVRGVRYVDDGKVITSTTIASGIDASLRAVDRLVGREIAENVARQIGYQQIRYLDDPRFQAPSTQLTRRTILAPLGANAAFRWGRQDLGVLLYDGVSELALGAVLDLHGTSLVAKTHVVAPERVPVRSRNGLTLVPRNDASSAPALDRVVLPGGDATDAQRQAVARWTQLRPERAVEHIHRNVGAGETAFDATLRDLAHTHGRMIATTIGQALFYAAGDSMVAGAGTDWPVTPILVPLALSLFGAGFVFVVGRALNRRSVAQVA
jgi:transcriptional regulator GlxA family with amidase domain